MKVKQILKVENKVLEHYLIKMAKLFILVNGKMMHFGEKEN